MSECQVCHGTGIAEYADQYSPVTIPRAQYEALRHFLHVKDSIDYRLNECLCEMKPDYDDSITGFNEAWDVIRKIFDREYAALRAAGMLEK